MRQEATAQVLRASPTQHRIPKWRFRLLQKRSRLLDVTDADIMRVEGDLLRSVAKHRPSRQWPMGTVRRIIATR